MECPVCGQAAPRGANFCFACGTALARICPRCQAGQSPGARFCPECGAPLGARPGDGVEDAGGAAADAAPPDAPRPVAPELLDDTELDAALARARQRESRRRLAVVAGALLLVLALLGGAVFWMRGVAPPLLERTAERTAAGPAPPLPASAPPEAAPPAPAVPPPPPAVAPPPPAVASPPPAAPSPAELPSRAPALPQADASRGAGRAPRVSLPEPEPSAVAALPQQARADVRVEVATERLGGGVTFYTVKLRERDGAPVTGADVTIRGRRRDGALVEAALDPAGDAGVYRAALRVGDVAEPRLRVASAGRIQEVPLD
jgi:hypothetical protein